MSIFKRKNLNQPPPVDPAKLEVPKGPKIFYWAAGIIILAVIALGLLATMRKVEVDQVGVRVTKFGFGIFDTGTDKAKSLPPGWHPIIPYLHQLVVFQKNIQTFEMTSKSGGIRQPDNPSLEIRTSDGYKVNVDITIFYRVMEDRANRVLANYSNDQDIKSRGIQAKAPGTIQTELGKMATADNFYDSRLRTAKLEKAREILNNYFNPQGIAILDIVVRDFEFPEEYEAAILRKVLAEQLKRVQESMALAAAAEADWKKTIAQGDRDAMVERARGSSDAVKLEAEGQRGKLVAQAKGKTELANALAGPGGSVYVGMEYLKALKGLELMVLPSGKNGLNPLDAGAMVRSLEPK
jgi:regulator of protease activity HflC (stomatin/prohibitin superfamily)